MQVLKDKTDNSPRLARRRRVIEPGSVIEVWLTSKLGRFSSMDEGARHSLPMATKQVYEVFRRYTNSGTEFCSFCYTEEDKVRITSTKLADLVEEDLRTLLWETANHWENANVYRHYLPRILDALGPPLSVDDIYPAHLFETLLALGFGEWATVEKTSVVEYLLAVKPFLDLDQDEEKEWEAGLTSLALTA